MPVLGILASDSTCLLLVPLHGVALWVPKLLHRQFPLVPSGLAQTTAGVLSLVYLQSENTYISSYLEDQQAAIPSLVEQPEH